MLIVWKALTNWTILQGFHNFVTGQTGKFYFPTLGQKTLNLSSFGQITSNMSSFRQSLFNLSSFGQSLFNLSFFNQSFWICPFLAKVCSICLFLAKVCSICPFLAKVCSIVHFQQQWHVRLVHFQRQWHFWFGSIQMMTRGGSEVNPRTISGRPFFCVCVLFWLNIFFEVCKSSKEKKNPKSEMVHLRQKCF